MKIGSKPLPVPSTRARFLASTAGRTRFPDVIQDAFGHKCMTGFHRYGRALGAVIPLEAVFMLAGQGDKIDPETQERIRESARALLEQQELAGIR